jgi:AcrR family transcriptional regulator
MARPRAHDYDDKRKLILECAGELFARRGYGGASITMIAKACGVSKALLYHYYPDKEAVLFDIISEHLLHLVEVVKEAGDELHAMTEALLDAYRNADAEHQVQINDLKLLPPDKQEMLKDIERELVRRFAGAIARAVPDLAEEFVKPVTMSLFGMLNWHYLWFREGRGLTRADYARLAIELVLKGALTATGAVVAERADSKDAILFRKRH